MTLRRTMFASSPARPTTTVAQLASIGTPYEFRIWTVYGRIARMPVSCDSRNSDITRKKGFSVRLRVSSFIFSMSVGGGCVHAIFCLAQMLHEFERSFDRCSAWNSCSTYSAGTHPRSHCSDLRASSMRFFDRSQNGVSGIYRGAMNSISSRSHGNSDSLTKQTATIVKMGMTKQYRAADRQSINVPIRKMMKNPSVAAIPAHVIRIPRMDGSLQSANVRLARESLSRGHKLPDFPNVSDDRCLHEADAQPEHDVRDEHLVDGRRSVHHYPCNDVRDVDEEHGLLSPERLRNPSGQNAAHRLTDVGHAGQPGCLRFRQMQELALVLGVGETGQSRNNDRRKRDRKPQIEEKEIFDCTGQNLQRREFAAN